MNEKDIKSKVEIQNEIIKKLTSISDETGVSVSMIKQIWKSIRTGFSSEKSINALLVCKLLINDLIQVTKEVNKVLFEHGVSSSEDVGKVVLGLCEKKLLKKESSDSLNSFKGLFESESIHAFIKNEKIRKKLDWYRKISYGFYIVGFSLVIGSYFKIVNYQIAWYAWGLGMIGWLLLKFRTRIEYFFSKKGK